MTTLAQIAREQVKKPVLILEIEGIDKLFGTDLVTVDWFLDDIYFFDTPGLRWDTPIADERNLDVISQDGTTKNLTQQILPDKGGTSSVQTLRIALVDNDQRVTRELDFNTIQELLGKKATVSFSYDGASHPKDSLPIIRGYIDDYEVVHGAINLSVSHPENLKRKQIYTEYVANLTADITNSQTNIPATLTDSLYLSQDSMESFIRINDEVMKVLSKTSSSITVQRAQLGTIATTHESGDDISALYKLTGQPIELALKIMLSGENDLSYGETGIRSIGFVDLTLQPSNAIFFGQIDVEKSQGVVIGDTIQILSGPNAGSYTITGFESTIFGFYVEVNQNLIQEVEANTSATFLSKYSTLPFGLGLTGNEVDVAGHENIVQFNPENFPEYEFYLSEPPEGKEFIDKQIYFPVALYSVPRSARISCKLVQPPLATSEIVRIDEKNLVNIQSIKVKRSTHKYLYNTLFYRYDLDPVDDKYLAGNLFRNEFSLARIKIGTKQMSVESQGLRNNLDTQNLLFRQQQRIFDRYRFAAQEIQNVEVPSGVGYSIEVGDIVIFGSEGLQLTDLSEGVRAFNSRLCEVINKSFDLFTGKIVLTLLESAYDLNARYGIISLSSLVDAGATQTELPLKLSFSVGEYERDTQKWEPFIGLRVRVRSEDYSDDEIVRIVGIKSQDNRVLLVEPLSFTPSEDYVIEVPDYELDQDVLYKDLFVYKNPSTEITSVISSTVLEVDDPTPLFVGAEVYIISADAAASFDTFLDEGLEIDQITGNQITLNKATPGVPVGSRIELVGFTDGAPYRVV